MNEAIFERNKSIKNGELYNTFYNIIFYNQRI